MVIPSATSFLTNAGDAGFLLPVTIVSSAMFWRFHSRQLAWILLRSVGLAAVLIVALKMIFLSCGTQWQTGIQSPSGHACMSAAVYGCLATVVAAARAPRARAAVGALIVVLVGAIAASRVLLGVHTLAEVLIGLAIGAGAQQLFAWSYARMEPLQVNARTFGVAFAVTVLLAFGLRIPAESALRHVARRVGASCAADGPHPLPALLRYPSERSNAATSSASSRAL